MTEPSKPTVESAARSRWRRGLCRAAGLAAVVLGGWCLWLGFPAATKPLESEAFRDWNDENTSPALEDLPQTSDARPGRLSARITHISNGEGDVALQDSRVMPANRADQEQTADGVLTVAGFATDVDDHEPRRLTQESKSPAGAWLTGTIEYDAPADDGPAQIPAWKRGSKSRSLRGKTQERR